MIKVDTIWCYTDMELEDELNKIDGRIVQIFKRETENGDIYQVIYRYSP